MPLIVFGMEHVMPLMLPWYAACAVLVKTSLLGLGVVTIGLAVIALVALRLRAAGLPTTTHQGLRRVFKAALWLHVAAYGVLVGKLIIAMLSDASWQDIPTFIISHLVMHHVMSGISATLLIVLTIRLYNQRRAMNAHSLR